MEKESPKQIKLSQGVWPTVVLEMDEGEWKKEKLMIPIRKFALSF